jgi:hypothetical protein
LAGLSSSQIHALTTTQVSAFDSADFAALSSSQMRALGTDDIAAISSTQLVALDTTHIAALSAAQLNALGSSDLNALTTTQFAAFTTAQIRGLETSYIAALETADIVAFTTAEIRALSTSQIYALTSVQLQALETSDIAAMTTAQVQAFDTADIAAMSSAQLGALMHVTPLVLDLDGNGVTTQAIGQGAVFDLTGTGHPTQVGWVGGHDGLLALDRNGDGIINDGRELFGAVTLLPDGQRAGNGFNALAALDSNHDGHITAADAQFGQLRVWVDANHNGRTDAGELKGLADLGITSLNLTHVPGDHVDHGNVIGLLASYTTADGRDHQMADVWFAREASAAEAANPPALDEVLLAPSDLGLGTSRDAAVPPPPLEAVVSGGHHRFIDEDLVRHHGPLV